MKKLGKLSINPDRVMKNEELVNLRGGDYYGYPCFTCTVYYSNNTHETGGCCLSSAIECQIAILKGETVDAVICN